MSNPLVGRTFHFTWTQGGPGIQTYEMTFVSETEKTSKNISGQDYESTDEYNLAEIAPDIYHLTWTASSGFSMAIAVNFQTKRTYGFYVEPAYANAIEGTVTELMG